MGEEEKKPEEAKMENKSEEPEKKEDKKQPEKPAEDKKDEKKTEESKDAKDTKESKDQPPPPPPDIVLKVYMHCEGCARKVRRSLKGFEGVEAVITDCTTSKVVVKGEKADPLKVLERVQRKSHGQVELLSPIPKPPAPEEKKPEEKEKPKPEEKKEEPQIIAVILKVHMHCDACAQEIQRRVLKMKGVESAEADLKNSQVSVKGAFEPAKLVEFVYKRTGKHAVIVKEETEKKEKAEEPKGEKKAEEGQKDKKSGAEGQEKTDEEKKEAEKEAKPEAVPEENKVVEMKVSEFQYYPPPGFAMDMYAYPYPPAPVYQYPTAYPVPYQHGYPYQQPVYAYEPRPPPPPQIFSDENPNACSVM